MPSDSSEQGQPGRSAKAFGLSDADDLGESPDRPAKSRSRMTLVALLIVLAAAIGLLTLSRWKDAQLSTERANSGLRHPAVGEPLPELHLEPLVGTETTVELADVKGQVVLINYWGTWCPPCRVEFPHIVELSERFGDREDFRFLSVSCIARLGGDTSRLQSDTAAYLEHQNVDFPVYSDIQGISRWALLQAGRSDSFAFPTTVVLDRQGVIQGVWVGYASGYEQGMGNLVDRLLDASAEPAASESAGAK
ncbi:MAG: TlpA family protein disulfide reductase [Pirellulaceae bacterium]|nr:redoxin domain-containing protein [Planctomycetales bacterium]